MRSSLLILDMKEDHLHDSGKEEGGKTFRELIALGMNDE